MMLAWLMRNPWKRTVVVQFKLSVAMLECGQELPDLMFLNKN
jgi:hypothetical protein